MAFKADCDTEESYSFDNLAVSDMRDTTLLYISELIAHTAHQLERISYSLLTFSKKQKYHF